MLEVTDNVIEKRIRFDNPWWDGEPIPPLYRNLKKRVYFKTIFDLLTGDIRRAAVVYGPRRVGKTVLLYQVIEALLDQGTAGQRILYLSADVPTYAGVSLEHLLELFLNRFEHSRTDRVFVFVDEVQYLRDWQRHLKSLVDSFQGVRFLVSGSAAAALRRKSIESGAGRFTDFLVPPLSFLEFLYLAGDSKVEVTDDAGGSGSSLRASEFDLNDLNEKFVRYLNYGGFPEAVLNPEIKKDMSRYVANDIIDKVLLKDLPSVYGIDNPTELHRFFAFLAYNTSQEINPEELASKVNLAKNTIRKYFEYLESSFLIHRIYRVDQSAKTMKRQTHFKVYLSNPSMRSALFGETDFGDDAMIGRLAETAVAAHMMSPSNISNSYYARWDKGEVDFIQLGLGVRTSRVANAIEVKWSDRPAQDPEAELPALLAFCRKNLLPWALVLTRSTEKTVDIRGIRLSFEPVAKYCLTQSAFTWLRHHRDILNLDGPPSPS